MKVFTVTATFPVAILAEGDVPLSLIADMVRDKLFSAARLVGTESQHLAVGDMHISIVAGEQVGK